MLFRAPGLQLPPDPVTAEQAIEEPNLVNTGDGCLLEINRREPLPFLPGCEALQVVMRPDVVVKPAALVQRTLKRVGSCDLQRLEPRFQCSKQALDAPVAPGRGRGNRLFVDARQSQERPKHPAVEHRLVVGSQEAGFAMFGNRQTQVAQQRPTGAVSQALERQTKTGAVVNKAQQGVALSAPVGKETQIGGPSVIVCNFEGRAVADVAAKAGYCQLVVAHSAADKGLADGRSRALVQAVEGFGDLTTPGLVAQQGFKAQNLLQNPVGFLSGAGQ